MPFTLELNSLIADSILFIICNNGVNSSPSPTSDRVDLISLIDVDILPDTSDAK